MGINWIDFSKKDTDKALEAMKNLAEKGAIDEIGIGVIRDGFADIFFPGTSTLHTHAKYLVLVPWLIKCTNKEYNKSKNKNFLEYVKVKEREIAEKLVENSEHNEVSTDGIIGHDIIKENKNKTEFVVYPPSRIYWNALRVFGIIPNSNISSTKYMALYHEEREKNKLRKKIEDEDQDDSGTKYKYKMNVSDACDEINLDSVLLKLTHKEASFIKDRICDSVPNSLLAWILKNNYKFDCIDFECFTEEICKLDGTESFRELLNLANKMNQLIYMIRIRYNYILLVKNRELTDEAKKVKEAWESIKVDTSLADIESTKKVINKNQNMYMFLEKALQLYNENKLDDLDLLIEKREQKIKSISRAKLKHKERYTKPIAMEKLNYRLDVAKKLCNNIMEVTSNE